MFEKTNYLTREKTIVEEKPKSDLEDLHFYREIEERVEEVKEQVKEIGEGKD